MLSKLNVLIFHIPQLIIRDDIITSLFESDVHNPNSRASPTPVPSRDTYSQTSTGWDRGVLHGSNRRGKD